MNATTAQVGLVGAGAMGSQLARQLAATEQFTPVVYDVNPDALTALADVTGLRTATKAAQLADCDVLITMLPNGQVVRTVLLGAPSATGESRSATHEVGLCTFLQEGTTVIDMSSSAPAGTVELAATLRARGLPMVDAPVSGGVARAATGTLSIMVGGLEEHVDRCRPVLDVLGSQVFHVGPPGAGHAMKALNNMASATGLAVAVEVLAVGRRFGLDPAVMLEVLNASTGRNNSTENKIGQQVLSRAFAGGFAMQLMTKDLQTAMDLAHQTGTPTPISAACLEEWLAALNEVGGQIDHTAIARYIEQRAGTLLESQALDEETPEHGD